jgi:hypothetical protein
MGILGGLDVGFGANMQVVRTNYLVVKTTAAGTTQQMANLLSLYNQNVMDNARGNNGLKCDYITGAHAPSDAGAAGVDDPTVLSAAAGSVVDFPVIGFANPATNQNTNHGVIAVLSIGAVEFTAKSLDAATAIPPVLADNNTAISNGELLKDLAVVSATAGATGGVVKTVNLDGMVDDVLAALGGTLTVADTALSTLFVEKGNSTGATQNPANIDALTHATNENCLGVISVTSLVGAGFM